VITQDLQMVEVWLAQPWPNGVIAAGGCSADARPFTRTLHSSRSLVLPPEFWVTLNEAVAQLGAYGCGGDRATWVFEGAVMHVATRSDGAWAAAIVTREVSPTIEKGVQARLREFVSMGE
jgi:hypothetical protein